MKNKEELIKTGIKQESVKFGITEGRINEFVSRIQFKIIGHLNAKDMENRFMLDKNGKLLGEIAPIMNCLLIEC